MKLLRRLSLALAVTALALPAAAHAGPIAGVNISVVQPPLSPLVMTRLAQSGVHTVRLFMGPGRSGPTGTPSDYAGLVDQLHSAGIQPIFDVVADPANPPISQPGIDAYVSYLRTAAQMFRGKVAGWEIWNEEDAGLWWNGVAGFDSATPDAGPYVRLLKAAYPAAKAADPGTPVVVGGLTGNDYAFVQSIYDHGGRGYFDAVATHTDTACGITDPYSFYRDPAGPVSIWSFLGIRSVHDVMVRNGDGGTPIWMTELGWSTSSQVCDKGFWAGRKAGGVSEAQQAQFIAHGYHCLSQYPYVQRALVFRLEETPGDGLDDKFGILRPDDSPKPAFDALSTYAHQGDTLAGEQCGDFSGPSLTVAAPTAGARYAKTLFIKATASDPSGIQHIALLYDGTKKVTSFWTHNANPQSYTRSITWQHAKYLSLGRHTITIQAFDASGNMTSQTVRVTKVGTLGTAARHRAKRSKATKRRFAKRGRAADRRRAARRKRAAAKHHRRG